MTNDADSENTVLRMTSSEWSLLPISFTADFAEQLKTFSFFWGWVVKATILFLAIGTPLNRRAFLAYERTKLRDCCAPSTRLTNFDFHSRPNDSQAFALLGICFVISCVAFIHNRQQISYSAFISRRFLPECADISNVEEQNHGSTNDRREGFSPLYYCRLLSCNRQWLVNTCYDFRWCL